MTSPTSDVELPPGSAEVLAECAALIDGFSAAGRRLYLVGGIVRDLYRGGPLLDDLDLDFTTDATPTVVKAIVGPVAEALWTQGERFGTIAAKIAGRLVEITTHRAEAYDPESRKPAVVFADDILVDLSRRDFTINALAIELTSDRPRLIDPFDGVGDLRGGRLRTPLAPTESFSDDPLRMMRAARFASRLGVVPDADVIDAMRSMAGRLDVVSVERVRVELDKLLLTDDPSAGLELLLTTGLASGFLPELTARAVDEVAAARRDPRLRLSVVLADVGETAARKRARALRHSRSDIELIGTLVGLAEGLRGHGVLWTDAEIRRLAQRAGPDLDDVVELASVSGVIADVDQSLRTAIVRLRRTEDLDDLRPALDGQEVMERLGVGPGREVGDALRFLTDLRLDDGLVEREAALERLGDWWAERSR